MQPSQESPHVLSEDHLEVSLKKCQICCPMDPEIKKILFSLLQKFQRQKSQLQQPIIRPQRHLDHLTQKNFQDLINTLFFKKFRNLGANSQCQHKGLQKYFRDNLKCSLSQLNRMSHKIVWQRVKFSYHIDTISQQIRSFPKVIMPDNKEIPSSSNTISSDEKKEKKKKKNPRAQQNPREEPSMRNNPNREQQHQNVYLGQPQSAFNFPQQQNLLQGDFNFFSIGCFDPSRSFFNYPVLSSFSLQRENRQENQDKDKDKEKQ